MRKQCSDNEKMKIRRLRQRYKPKEIAKMLGRTEAFIKKILWMEKQKGAEFPKLKHGNRKRDTQTALNWRNMIRCGMKYKQIQVVEHVHPAVISRVLAAEARGELI